MASKLQSVVFFHQKWPFYRYFDFLVLFRFDCQGQSPWKHIFLTKPLDEKNYEKAYEIMKIENFNLKGF